MHMFKAGQKRSQQSGLRSSRRSLRGGFGVPKDTMSTEGRGKGGVGFRHDPPRPRAPRPVERGEPEEMHPELRV